jgi:rSAM/selenodomain-associated transferase 1
VENPQNSQAVTDVNLGVFVKAPVPGLVKTRLCPPLTMEQAAALYRTALHETIERMAAGPWQLSLFYAGDEGYFAHNFPGLPRVAQKGVDLGARLQHALSFLLSTGRIGALIGSDSPDLPLTQVKAAFAGLNQHTAVTIPAADGGYVLIGARDECPPLFSNIPWSSDQVLAATRCRAADSRLDYIEVGGWEDIDDAAGLRRLLQRSPDSATARHLQRHLAGCLDLSPAMADNRRQLDTD